jgi:hypothetical protein
VLVVFVSNVLVLAAFVFAEENWEVEDDCIGSFAGASSIIALFKDVMPGLPFATISAPPGRLIEFQHMAPDGSQLIYRTQLARPNLSQEQRDECATPSDPKVFLYDVATGTSTVAPDVPAVLARWGGTDVGAEVRYNATTKTGTRDLMMNGTLVQSLGANAQLLAQYYQP